VIGGVAGVGQKMKTRLTMDKMNSRAIREKLGEPVGGERYLSRVVWICRFGDKSISRATIFLPPTGSPNCCTRVDTRTRKMVQSIAAESSPTYCFFASGSAGHGAGEHASSWTATGRSAAALSRSHVHSCGWSHSVYWFIQFY